MAITGEVPIADQTDGTENQGGPEVGQDTEDGDGGRGCIVNSDWRPAPPPRSMEEDEGLVQSGGGP